MNDSQRTSKMLKYIQEMLNCIQFSGDDCEKEEIINEMELEIDDWLSDIHSRNGTVDNITNIGRLSC